MELKITPSGQTIVKPTALGPGANTDTKLLIYGLFQKGRVLAQDGLSTNLSGQRFHRLRRRLTVRGKRYARGCGEQSVMLGNERD